MNTHANFLQYLDLTNNPVCCCEIVQESYTILTNFITREFSHFLQDQGDIKMKMTMIMIMVRMMIR